jgi:apolipoprotein N-acyltransferase
MAVPRWRRRPAPATGAGGRLGATLLTAAALGAGQTLAFVHTAWWPLPLLATAWLAWQAGRGGGGGPGGVRRAALTGWVFGSAWLGAGVWWLFISMHRYGGLPAPLAAAAVALLAAALALYLALAMALYARWRRGRALTDVPLFAALWLAAELARGVFFTGFPWVASGYAQVDAPLAALAPWVGVYGIGAAGAALAALALHGWRGAGAAAGLLAALALAGPGEHSRPAGTLQLALLQTNVAQDRKFDPAHLPEALAWVAQQLTAAEAELVVAPETALPLLPAQLEEAAPGYWAALRVHFARPGRAALVGLPLGDYERGYTNSVVGLADGPEYRYDKHHLVPFGEFIPAGFRWFTDLMHIPLGDFARGVVDPPSFVVRGQRIAPNICYEDLFGEELARRFADPARAPTVLANVSNIGWFGRTVAVDQHLHISRLRSLELQRPMVRATNTGATAVIDHRGVVTAMLAPHTRGVLVAPVQGREGLTPFARWAAAAGLAPLWALAVGVPLALALAGRGRRAAP